MELTNKTILVTGGAGTIGKELIKRLIKVSGKVVCIDRVEIPKQFIPFNIKYIQKDLNTMNTKDILEIEPEIIFHLAATFERTEETPEFWNENYNDNIRASHFVLDGAKNCTSLKRFVFASSYLVYDQQQYLFQKSQKNAVKLNELTRIDTRNLCGVSKYYTEQELVFLKKYGTTRLNSVSARIFRVYGIQSRDFLSRCIRAGLRGETIELYRKEGLFDYIYAGDVADGLIRLAIADVKGPVNLGYGKARSVEMALAIIKKEIHSLKIKEKEREILYEASCSDISKLKKVTKWQPVISLEEGLSKVIENERAAIQGI